MDEKNEVVCVGEKVLQLEGVRVRCGRREL